MASRKRSTRPFGKSKEDRLSNLPDALLHHILSFLTTQEVVQTCVLSKRWRYLWTCVPFLDFDLKAFQSVERDLWDKMVPFTNFINQFLLRHNCSRIVKFRCDPSSYAMQHDLLESWIYYALQRGVQELYLNIFCHSTPGPVVLPHCFTGCKSLTKLTLIAYYHSIVLPKSFVLPSLKSLHLAGDFDVDGDLISSCPNLEFLKIDNIQNVNIHALNLRFLDFSYKNRGCACIPHIAKVKLFAPKLTNFKLKSFTSILFSAENLASLDEVNINVHPSFHGYYGSTDEFKQELCSCMIRMLNEFHNTKSMILSSTTIEVLSLNPAALSAYPSAFPNLKYLKLEMDRWCKVIKIPACLLTYFCNDATSLDVIMFEGVAIKAEKLFEGSSFRQHQHAVSLFVLRNSYGPCNIPL